MSYNIVTVNVAYVTVKTVTYDVTLFSLLSSPKIRKEIEESKYKNTKYKILK